MEIHMTFKQMDSTEGIKIHAQEKTEKLNKFISGPFSANWVFFLEGDRQVADLKIKGPHIDLFAQSSTHDLYQSIDDAVSKIEKQLRKHKEITKDHMRS